MVTFHFSVGARELVLVGSSSAMAEKIAATVQTKNAPQPNVPRKLLDVNLPDNAFPEPVVVTVFVIVLQAKTK